MNVPSVPQRIAAHAAASPDAVAVVGQDGSLTYAELISRADLTARRLLANGVTPGDLVGVCLGRGASLVVTLLGVLRAGCAYLPLDPEYPADRLHFMLTDSGAAAVAGTATQLATVPFDVVAIDVADAEASAPATTELPAIDAGDLAYVIYTSGSTGTPKGVAVEHGHVARLFDAVQQRIPVTQADTWSWFHSSAFDFSVWEIWGALTSGGRVVVVGETEARDPAAFLTVLRRSGTTILSQTPSAFQSLLALLREDEPSWSVRAVVLGGEAVSVDAVADILQAPDGKWPRLYNLYGITETTVHTTVKELTRADLDAGVRSPIGTPLADLRLAVLDEDRRPVSLGEPGELWVGGAGVARGYVGRPQLTVDRFATGVVPKHGQLRWYRSGDLARQLPSGEFEYIGRIDRQVKVRGFRIELGEIEAALTGHPAVAAAAVELRDTQLVAYLAVAQQVTPSLDEMRAWLAARVPDHMIPSSFVSLDALPLTANGKVDRDALARVQVAPLPRRADVGGPRTSAETALHAIWADVLGTTDIGRDDNFFAIGGDSMLALRVVSAGKAAGIALTVRDLFANPTLAGLASIVGGSDNGHGEPEDTTHHTEAAGRLIPASQLQRGMLFEAARNPSAGTYHVVSATRVTSTRAFSEREVRSALGRLVEDNIALRMSFDLLHYDRPMQVEHRPPEQSLEYLDVSDLGSDEQQQRIDDVFAKEQAHRFGEHDYPLWRMVCVQVSPHAAEVMLGHHHAILDGWSVARFFDQFTAALGGRPYDSAPAGINEAAVRLEEEAVSAARDNEFWRAQVEAWAPVPVTRNAAGGAEGFVSAEARIDGSLRRAITDTAARSGCSPKHVHLAAHLRAIGRLAHWDDYSATGMVVNGRPELPGAHNALGMFLNIVPLSVTGLRSSWAELARAAMAVETALLPHRWFPQATMITKLGMPLLSVCFNYTDFSTTAMHGFLARVTETSPNGVPLTVSVLDDGIAVEAAAEYFSAEECAQLARWHEDNLRAAVGAEVPV